MAFQVSWKKEGELVWTKRKLSLIPIRSKLLRRQFETNVFGVLDVTTATLPYLRQSTDGCVVVVGSRSAWKPELHVCTLNSIQMLLF